MPIISGCAPAPDGTWNGWTANAKSADMDSALPDTGLSANPDVVFLVTGQSNAWGSGSTDPDAAMNEPHPHALRWDGSQWVESYFDLADDDVNPRPNAGFYATNAYADLHPEWNVGWIVSATQGTPIANWVSDDATKEYAMSVETTENALSAAGLPDLSGLFWLQGEADCNDAETANAYQDSFNNVVGKYQAESFWHNDTLFLANEFPKDDFVYCATVNEALASLNVDGDGYTRTLDAKDLPTRDGTHFTDESYHTLGGMWAEAVDEAPFDEDTGDETFEKGCGCSAASPAIGGLWLLALVGWLPRRRKSQSHP